MRAFASQEKLMTVMALRLKPREHHRHGFVGHPSMLAVQNDNAVSRLVLDALSR